MARPRRRKLSSENREDEVKKRRIPCSCSESIPDNNDDPQVSAVVHVSPRSSQSEFGSLSTDAIGAPYSSTGCSPSSNCDVQHQASVNGNSNCTPFAYDEIVIEDKEEEHESKVFTFPRFLLEGLESENSDLAIQAIHDIAVRVRQMDDLVLIENATRVLESLYANMDDDEALEILKQEVHVLVIIAAALHTYNNEESAVGEEEKETIEY